MPSEKNTHKMNPWTLEFRRLAQPVLAPDTFFEVIADPRGSVVLQCSWLIPEEAAGVALRSRPIRLVVSAQAVQDYAAASAADRVKIDGRFQTWLEERLKYHTPSARRGAVDAQPEEWIIEPRMLWRGPR